MPPQPNPQYVYCEHRCRQYSDQLFILLKRGLFDQCHNALNRFQDELEANEKSDSVNDVFGVRIGGILNTRFGIQFLHEVQNVSRNQLLDTRGINGESVRQIESALLKSNMVLRNGVEE